MAPTDPLPPPLDAAGLDAIAEAGAALLGLTIDPAWRDAVRANLVALSAAARLVEGCALADDTDPAPVFQA